METFECLESTDDKPSILNFVLYFFFGISSQIYTLNGHLGQYKHFGINFNKKEQISRNKFIKDASYTRKSESLL